MVKDKDSLYRFAGQEGVTLNWPESSSRHYVNSAAITAVHHQVPHTVVAVRRRVVLGH
jgi:hypothetical protein